MSRKNTPPSYTDPGGPSIVEFHSYRLSPFGPALQKTKNKKQKSSIKEKFTEHRQRYKSVSVLQSSRHQDDSPPRQSIKTPTKHVIDRMHIFVDKTCVLKANKKILLTGKNRRTTTSKKLEFRRTYIYIIKHSITILNLIITFATR